MNKFGYDELKWSKAKAEAREVLIDVAKNRGRITYSDLADRIPTITFEHNDPRYWMLLGEISIDENDQGRGMLSAIVVHKHGDMLPGPGFFNLAKRLGKKTKTQIELFWLEEFNKVHDQWANKSK